MNLNKGISTPIALTIIVIIAITLIGVVLYYSNWQKKEALEPTVNSSQNGFDNNKDINNEENEIKEERFLIESNYENVMFSISCDLSSSLDCKLDTSLDFFLKSPSGQLFEGEDIKFEELTDDEQFIMLIKNPEQGEWTVLVHGSNLDDIDIQTLALGDKSKVAPKIDILNLDEDITIQIGETVEIKVSAFDSDSEADISLLRVQTEDIGNLDCFEFSGILIEKLKEKDGILTYKWKTDSLGSFKIIADIIDEYYIPNIPGSCAISSGIITVIK